MSKPTPFQALLPQGKRLVTRDVPSLEAGRAAVRAHLRVKRLPRPLSVTAEAEFYAAPSGRHGGVAKRIEAAA